MNPEEYLRLGEELVRRKTACGRRAGHVEAIKLAFTGPDRDSVVDAIKAYRRLVNRRV